MIKEFKILFLLFFIAACATDKKQLPEGVLGNDKMVKVLADIEEAEARIQISGMDDSTRKAAYRYYKFIFEKNNINDSVFSKSFSYYSGNPELLDKLFDDVITELSRRQGVESAKKKQ